MAIHLAPDTPGFVRLFVAIELPNAVTTELDALQGRIQANVPGDAVKWVVALGIHLTLKFLGAVHVSRIASVEEAIRSAAETPRPCELALGGLGVFPNERRPRVIWVGLTGKLDCLAAVQRSVEEALFAAGFERERRGFTPHLTLGRVRDAILPSVAAVVGAAVVATAPPTALRLPVASISLMRSELGRDGARYSRWKGFPIG